jgi:hypothetical protein
MFPRARRLDLPLSRSKCLPTNQITTINFPLLSLARHSSSPSLETAGIEAVSSSHSCARCHCLNHSNPSRSHRHIYFDYPRSLLWHSSPVYPVCTQDRMWANQTLVYRISSHTHLIPTNVDFGPQG